LGAVALLASLGAVTAWAQQPAGPTASAPYDMTRLTAYEAHIGWRMVQSAPGNTWVCQGGGSAIFIGENRFLTAAHVVDQNPFTDDCYRFGRADPVIEFAGGELKATFVAAVPWQDEGGLYYPGGADIALVVVDGRMIPPELRQSSPLAICSSDLPPGSAVAVATQYGISAARIAARVNDEFGRVDFAGRNGHSGGGVFDPEHRCLLGIISNGGVNGTNYVANETLRHFLHGPAAAAPARTRQASIEAASPDASTGFRSEWR
jgi:hypothetical protein